MSQSNDDEGVGERPPASGEGLSDMRLRAEPWNRSTRSVRRRIAPTARQIKSDDPSHGLKLSSSHGDGHLLHLAIEEVPACELWQEDRAISLRACPAGFMQFFDLRQPALLDIPGGHHILQVHLPDAVLRDCAQRQGLLFRGGLRCDLAGVHDDPVVRYLGLAILAISRRAEEARGPVPDLILQAIALHVVARYGETTPGRSARGMLAPWQERRAKDLIETSLTTGIALGQLAEACRLSRTHFARAFRRSTGISPHRWLQERRIERAMEMLRSERAPLAAIAQVCGFADQSHFTKIFTGIVGISPGQWQRQRRTAFDPDQTG